MAGKCLSHNHHKRIPLPIIVWGSDGLHVFMSSKVEHGATYTNGNASFRIATEGDNKGKLVEIVDERGIALPVGFLHNQECVRNPHSLHHCCMAAS